MNDWNFTIFWLMLFIAISVVGWLIGILIRKLNFVKAGKIIERISFYLIILFLILAVINLVSTYNKHPHINSADPEYGAEE